MFSCGTLEIFQDIFYLMIVYLRLKTRFQVGPKDIVDFCKKKKNRAQCVK